MNSVSDPALLDIRPYRSGDEIAIHDLFEASFGRSLPESFWNWRYCENPAGGPWIELAWAGETLAAHYAMSATTLHIEGRAVSAALSMTTMTHPAFRGRGLFPALAERLYSRFAAAGGEIVYGFPNANSHRGFVRDLHWQDLYEVPTLRATLAAARLPGTAANDVRVIDVPDARFDRCWMRIANRFPIWMCRDARWLAWRFAACPVHDYRLAAWTDGDEVRGWVVVKSYETTSLDIVDFIAEDDMVALDLMQWALAQATQRALPTITAWCPLGAPWRARIEGCGLRADGPVTYMGARALGGAESVLARSPRWGFSMADSDVY